MLTQGLRRMRKQLPETNPRRWQKVAYGSFPNRNTWKILATSTVFHSHNYLFLCEAYRSTTPAAEAGAAGLTGVTGVGGHDGDAAPCGHRTRGDLASRGAAASEAPTGDSTTGAADTCGREGTQRVSA